ncbi:MAG TPA: C69 family dipeptidase, partial [Thermophilibacter provencensis]|nr:C69 family dipeptidase [Thermophilibacter provencensis]
MGGRGVEPHERLVQHEIWWMETVGGHHWIARRVPDDCYVTMPN